METQYSKPVIPGGFIKKAFWAIAVIIVVILVITNVSGIVQPGNVGVVITAGSVSDDVKGEGFYLKVPFIQTVKQMEIRTQKMEWVSSESPITAASKDLQDVYVHAVVTFHPLPNQCGVIFQTIGLDYDEKIVRPRAINAIKTHTAKYNVAEILQNRERITQDVNEDLQKQLDVYNIVLENVSLVNIDFRPEYKQAIEQKQIAEKQVETQRYTLEKQALEAQQQVKMAEADKESKILAAEAQKQVKILEGQGVEEFNKLVSASITKELIEYKALQNQEKAIEKWSGQYPQVVAGGESIPMIQLPDQSANKTGITAGSQAAAAASGN